MGLVSSSDYKERMDAPAPTPINSPFSDLPSVNPLVQVRNSQRAGSMNPPLYAQSHDFRGNPPSIARGVVSENPAFLQNPRAYDSYIQTKAELRPLKNFRNAEFV